MQLVITRHGRLLVIFSLPVRTRNTNTLPRWLLPDSNTIYAATNDNHLWATFDGGLKWQQYDNGLFGVANGPVFVMIS